MPQDNFRILNLNNTLHNLTASPIDSSSLVMGGAETRAGRLLQAWRDGGDSGCGAHPPGFDSSREHRVSHWVFIPRICFLQILDISRGATMGLRYAHRLQGSVRLW